MHATTTPRVPHAAGAPLPSHADLRDVISLEKDVEGLNHRYRYALYHNIRTLAEHNGKKCVLPCTPLACIKVLEALGAYDRTRPVGQQLSGRTCMVYNRSEVVGRPLGVPLLEPDLRPLEQERHVVGSLGELFGELGDLFIGGVVGGYSPGGAEHEAWGEEE